MNAITERLFTNWHFSRWLRLGMGLFMLMWSIQTGDWGIAAFAGLFIFMSLTNSGCCGAQVCAIPNRKKTN
jgi:hypothetical protein